MVRTRRPPVLLIDPRFRFMVFVSRLHQQSCIGIVQHPQYQDRSDQAQQDEITRASGEGIGLFGERATYLKKER
jgi:hypothetical protein